MDSTTPDSWWQWAIGLLATLVFGSYWRLLAKDDELEERVNTRIDGVSVRTDAVNLKLVAVETRFIDMERRREEDRKEDREFRAELKESIRAIGVKIDKISNDERAQYQETIRDLRSRLRESERRTHG